MVRPGIETPADLKGKKLAAAPVSTDHYQLLAVLKQEGITEKEAQVIAIPQPEIVAAWKRGDIDGAFVWDPALTELKKDGKVLLTSGQVADRGAPTFSAIVATGPISPRSIPISSRNTLIWWMAISDPMPSDAAAWERRLRERQADLQASGRHSRRECRRAA